jgi:hypothetical protein
LEVGSATTARTDVGAAVGNASKRFVVSSCGAAVGKSLANGKKSVMVGAVVGAVVFLEECFLFLRAVGLAVATGAAVGVFKSFVVTPCGRAVGNSLANGKKSVMVGAVVGAVVLVNFLGVVVVGDSFVVTECGRAVGNSLENGKKSVMVGAVVGAVVLKFLLILGACVGGGGDDVGFKQLSQVWRQMVNAG